MWRHDRSSFVFFFFLFSYSSTPAPLSALPPSPVKVPNFKPASIATISARSSNTSLGTVLSYIEIRSLGWG